ncbi:hypothetical protein [Paenirhodobacter populi]|uniref:hypothetical protein n=1 Tax=Paenirhodobacter populi TaxID=2306993 RepID=UPI0013E4021C|nr:hypothetical protein [Sinirhodobacter populi]
MSYYLRNEVSGTYAHRDSIGQHDGLTTTDLDNAARFDTWGEASDYSQNFGPDWSVDEI